MYLVFKKHKKTLLSAVFLLLFYLAVKVMGTVVVPLVFAFALSYLLKSPVNFLYRRIKIPKKLSSLLLLSSLFIAVAATVSAIGVRLFSELDTFLEALKGIGIPISSVLGDAPNLIGSLSSVGRAFPKGIISLTVFVFSAFYFTAEHNAVLSLIKSKDFSSHLFGVIEGVFSGCVRAYALLFLFTFASLSLAFSLMKISFAFVLALAVSLFDILPLVGTGSVLIPWAVYAFFSDRRGECIFLVSVFLFITLAKELLEPRLLGGFVGLHPLVSLLSVSSGYLLMGVFGAFFVPLSVCIIREARASSSG